MLELARPDGWLTVFVEEPLLLTLTLPNPNPDPNPDPDPDPIPGPNPHPNPNLNPNPTQEKLLPTAEGEAPRFFVQGMKSELAMQAAAAQLR